ncbi:cyclin-like protein [Exidia glandulosa HHB12029]|uniref:Cyclin-like protein n=1 Tax=Exidia glandulosa HHB12029 TaxID=1314781 RepID=A0A165IFW1_EXIGL|nr:cyclin-like protein [Exidia glandulosa HHB12029]
MAQNRVLNPLASLAQVERTPSMEDGMPWELEEDLRAYGCKLIQQAGILLKQNQVAMATAQILFQRFWYVTSMKQFGIGDIGMGALYLASKLEECPLRMRDLINVYDLLLSRALHSSSSTPGPYVHTPMLYFAPAFYELKDALVVSEMQILKRLGFNTQVVLPYGTLVNYLRVLELSTNTDACRKAWGYLNDSLQTPAFALYPVPAVICACVLLATRHLAIPLPDDWWILFDAEWEDVHSIAGMIMRLYRPRQPAERLRLAQLVTKREVRRWLEEHSETAAGRSLRAP